ncbi:neuromedin-U receptor 2-like [Salvelinus sp. IW2-2015]|uniref:neuromedin-U receptor 2-like n=1 Tax=Salvelinus sp. IW2-2015 TaxID=2691554 RepID=UPI0038D49543
MEKYCLDSLSNISEQHGMFCNITFLNVTGNDTGTKSIEDKLLEVLGPKRSPVFLPISLVYLLIFLLGVSGNLLTCTVISKHKKMCTPTNLYLFSLAVSDLLVLFFGMPLEIYDLWQNYPFPFGEGVCYFKIFLFETVCFASILNVTVLSVERYIAVVHPLKTRYVATNKHAKHVISAVWVLSLVCAIPNTSLHGIYYLNLPEKVAESAICSLIGSPWIYNLVILITTACFYIVPVTVISGLYLGIGIKLGRERHLSRGTMRKNCSANISWRIHVERVRRRQVTKMLAVVVLVFAICWAPFHIDRLLWSCIMQWSVWTDLNQAVYQCVHLLSGILFYLSSAVNPVIYNLLSTRFRECFWDLVCTHTEDTTAGKDSTPSAKILLVPSGPVPKIQARPSDHNSLTPLLSPTGNTEITTLTTFGNPPRAIPRGGHQRQSPTRTSPAHPWSGLQLAKSFQVNHLRGTATEISTQDNPLANLVVACSLKKILPGVTP